MCRQERRAAALPLRGGSRARRPPAALYEAPGECWAGEKKKSQGSKCSEAKRSASDAGGARPKVISERHPFSATLRLGRVGSIARSSRARRRLAERQRHHPPNRERHRADGQPGPQGVRRGGCWGDHAAISAAYSPGHLIIDQATAASAILSISRGSVSAPVTGQSMGREEGDEEGAGGPIEPPGEILGEARGPCFGHDLCHSANSFLPPFCECCGPSPPLACARAVPSALYAIAHLAPPPCTSAPVAGLGACPAIPSHLPPAMAA
jgi:hypothetical protein